MFEQLFQRPSALARHQNAPYAEERARYLSHCLQQGYSRTTVLYLARELLWVARKLSVYPDLRLTLAQIETVAQGWEERQRGWGQTLHLQWTRRRFVMVARLWLRFHGGLREPEAAVPCAEHLESFLTWMEVERGLAPLTIRRRAGYIGQFLHWYGPQGHAFSDMRLVDVDAFLVHGATAGWSRVSVNNVASALRVFLRYAAMQGWCAATLADAIRGPRIFAEEALPAGSDWADVQRVLASMHTDQPADIRDRAMLLLFALYGLRTSEVAALTLDDIDWENDRLQVTRAKGGKPRAYPLVPPVGNALVQYLQTVRPHSSSREIFLTLRPPYRPIARGTLYSLTRQRLMALGVRTKHYGPHALRHACAARLVSEGLSLKEIGDHLGHRSSKATRIYAKVDLPALRQVAAFDLGELS